MVIYLKRRKEWLFNCLLLLFVVIFVYGVGYFSTYLKYDDFIIIDSDLLIRENLMLKNELSKIDKIDIQYDDYVIGKVLYRDLYSFYEEIVINLGDDQVSVGDAVVNNYGLIGVIYKVEKDISYVKLLSSDYNVSVIVNDTYGNLNNGTISLLDKYSNIIEGDLVYTSNYGDILDGIYVGKVKNVTYDSDGLGKKAEIEIANNKNLNYIGVVKKVK